LVLDKSGSMNSCVEQTVESVNQQIKRIKEVAARFPEQEILTSLTLFNHNLIQVWNTLQHDSLHELTYSDYQPEGMTALLDAIGASVAMLQDIAGGEIEIGNASAVVVIITDGHENSSKRYTNEQVSSLIGELEKTGNWTFCYMGATLDAVQIAAGFNIRSNNAMQYRTNESFLLYNKLCDSLDYYLNKKKSGEINNDYLSDGEKE